MTIDDMKPFAVLQKCHRCGCEQLAEREYAGKKCTNFSRCTGEEPRDKIEVLKELYSEQQIHAIWDEVEETMSDESSYKIIDIERVTEDDIEEMAEDIPGERR